MTKKEKIEAILRRYCPPISPNDVPRIANEIFTEICIDLSEVEVMPQSQSQKKVTHESKSK